MHIYVLSSGNATSCAKKVACQEVTQVIIEASTKYSLALFLIKTPPRSGPLSDL